MTDTYQMRMNLYYTITNHDQDRYPYTAPLLTTIVDVH